MMAPLWMLAAGKKIKTIVSKIPTQIWVCAGIVLVFWLWGLYQHKQGRAEVQAAWDASRLKGKVVAQELQRRASEINTEIRIEYRDKVRVVHEQGEVLIKEVPRYIPADSCPLPAGFRVLHDAAATGESTSSTRGDHAPTLEAENLAARERAGGRESGNADGS